VSGGHLDGDVAVVTGGSGGIGRAVCLALAGAGAHVVVVARDAKRVGSVVEELTRAGTRPALGLALDVRREPDMAELAERTLDRYGRIDVLAACAAVGRGATAVRAVPSAVAQLPSEEWDDVIATNLSGTFLSSRAVLPDMIRRGRGDIVHVSSAPAGISGQPFAAAYCASKFGVNAFSEALAREVREFGVRVHLVFPGLVRTPLIAGTNLASRFGTPLAPERVAGLILYLIGLPRDVVLQPSRRYGASVIRSST
jgi:NAD(P)-dependent dehydrogenase (short-subunit alcohol dehydrogenase family)